MPYGDGTGPAGMGPMTGRGLGYCAGYNSPGFTRGVPAGRGFGWGRGFGRGWGFGFGRWAGWRAPTAPAYPARQIPVYREPTKEEEKEMLKAEKDELARELKEIEKRLKELK